MTIYYFATLPTEIESLDLNVGLLPERKHPNEMKKNVKDEFW